MEQVVVRNFYGLASALMIGGAVVALAGTDRLNAQALQDAGAGPVTAPLSAATPSAMAPRPFAPASFAELVERLQPAVVNISTRQSVQVATQYNPLTGQRRPVTQDQAGGGSGFLISADGYIVTNNHVVANNGREVTDVTVTFADRQEYRARIIGRDAASDLAVLKIDAGKPLPFVRFAAPDSARVGDWVVAIGNPLGLGSTVTAGIVSAVQRNLGVGNTGGGVSAAYDRFIQTDTAINRGNSGGPLFDLQGNVVGINNMLISPVGANIGVNFAIPADLAMPVVDALRRGARPERGYLGVAIAPITDDLAAATGLAKNRGEFVQRVEPGQPAAAAGLRPRDVVLEVNGQAVTPDRTLSYIVSNIRPGTRIPLLVQRDGQRLTLQAVVGARPSEEQLAQTTFDDAEEAEMPDGAQGSDRQVQEALGMAVLPLTPEIAGQLGVASTMRGLVIAAVAPGSDAARSGLRRGLVITSAGNRPTTTVEALAGAIVEAKRQNRTALLLEVTGRGIAPRYLPVRFAD